MTIRSATTVLRFSLTRPVPGGGLPEAGGPRAGGPAPGGVLQRRSQREAEGEGAAPGGGDRHPEELPVPDGGRAPGQGALPLLGVGSGYRTAQSEVLFSQIVVFVDVKMVNFSGRQTRRTRAREWKNTPPLSRVYPKSTGPPWRLCCNTCTGAVARTHARFFCS